MLSRGFRPAAVCFLGEFPGVVVPALLLGGSTRSTVLFRQRNRQDSAAGRTAFRWASGTVPRSDRWTVSRGRAVRIGTDRRRAQSAGRGREKTDVGRNYERVPGRRGRRGPGGQPGGGWRRLLAGAARACTGPCAGVVGRLRGCPVRVLAERGWPGPGWGWPGSVGVGGLWPEAGLGQRAAGMGWGRQAVACVTRAAGAMGVGRGSGAYGPGVRPGCRLVVRGAYAPDGWWSVIPPAGLLSRRRGRPGAWPCWRRPRGPWRGRRRTSRRVRPSPGWSGRGSARGR